MEKKNIKILGIEFYFYGSFCDGKIKAYLSENEHIGLIIEDCLKIAYSKGEDSSGERKIITSLLSNGNLVRPQLRLYDLKVYMDFKTERGVEKLLLDLNLTQNSDLTDLISKHLKNIKSFQLNPLNFKELIEIYRLIKNEKIKNESKK